MDSDIEFGKVEHAEPTKEVRPDRNRLFSVVPCGDVSDDDLPIFVDLDVMRDMEAHAQSNTHVELGGVLLGGQYVDSEGAAFVVVRECLRAEHYEATRGSFKFTHDTWAQITREREQFPNDLQLIGWYHTHPDWGVFLSGMDMFICENFFNRPLDVALVIDPCRGDRGWFYWIDGEKREKKRVSGFYLLSNRYRAEELEYFASLYLQSTPGSVDPRYASFQGDLAVQPIVNIHDQRPHVHNLALMGMLVIQFFVLSLVAYRVLSPAEPPAPVTQQAQAPAEPRRDSDRVYEQVLAQLIENTPASEGTLDYFVRVETENQRLDDVVEGQAARIEDLKSQNRTLVEGRQASNKEIATLEGEIKTQKATISGLNDDLAAARSGEPVEAETSFWFRGIAWPIVVLIIALTAVCGIFTGVHLGKPAFEEQADNDE